MDNMKGQKISIYKGIVEWLSNYATHSIDSKSMDTNRFISPKTILDFSSKGLFGLLLSKKNSGLGLSHKEYLKIIQLLSEIDLNLAVFIAGHNIICSHLEKILPESKNGKIKTYAQGHRFIGIGITEEDVGSNIRKISTTATKLPNGDWLISGQKKWAGLASWANEVCVLAKCENHKLKLFLISLDTPGVKILSQSDSMGLRAFPRNTVKFENVRVKSDRLLYSTEFKSGILLINSIFKLSRISIGAMSLGIMKISYHIMKNYSKRRLLSSGIMSENGNVQVILSEQALKIRALECLLNYSHRFLDSDNNSEISYELAKIVKNIGAESAWVSADTLMQFLGGRGYEENNMAPKIMRDCRAMRIFEGTTEVLRLSLGASFYTGKELFIEWLHSIFKDNDYINLYLGKVYELDAKILIDNKDLDFKLISLGEFLENLITCLLLKKEASESDDELIDFAIKWYEIRINIAIEKIKRKINLFNLIRGNSFKGFDQQNQLITPLQNRIPIENKYNQYLYEFSDKNLMQNALIEENDANNIIFIHELFLSKVKQHPQKMAITCNNTNISYQKLEKATRNLAKNLIATIKSSSGDEKSAKIVAIITERSEKTIISMLAALRAGFAFCIIDSNYPGKRIENMLQDLQPCLLLFDKSFKKFQKHAFAKLQLTDKVFMKPSYDIGLPQSLSLNLLAYVVYTSGTSGTPKGVLIEHDAISRVIIDLIKLYDLDDKSRVFQFVEPMFDVFISDVFMTLCSGGRLFMKQGTCTLSYDLINYLEKHAITHIQLPASILSSLPYKALPKLSHIGVGGEVCPKESFEKWNVNKTFYNLYGTSETSITALAYKCKKKLYPLPLSYPIGGKEIIVLDENSKPVSKGEIGELLIGGHGLARGYINLPDLSAKKFININGKIFYKTGDVVKVISDKEQLLITYVGRIDNQIKLNGIRIEPEEIEAAILKVSSVRMAVVTCSKVENNNTILAAYLVLHDSSLEQKVIERCKKNISQLLPRSYMPNIFIVIDSQEIPYTKNGKINRGKLATRLISPKVTDNFKTVLEYDTPIQTIIFDSIKNTLNINKINKEDDFFELGGDSLKATEFLIEIQRKTSISIPLAYIFKHSRVGSLVDMVVRLNNQTRH